MSFPLNPADGDGYINGLGTRYVYNATDNKWVIQSQDLGVTGANGINGTGITGMINININGGEGYIANGYKGDFKMPYKYKIYDWTMVGDIAGDAWVKIYQSTYANYPPNETGLISIGDTGPNLKMASKNTGSCTGWLGATGAAGNIMRVEVASCTGLHRLSLMIGYSSI